MALFSQDDSDDETPTIGAAFSGGPSPDEPDDETETPSPADGDEKALPAGDDSSAYARSPQESTDGEAGLADQFAPSEQSTQDYAQAAPAGTTSELPGLPAVADNSANRAELEYAKSHFNPADYKPSIGRKILGSLAGAATTFGGGNGNQVVQNVEGRPLREAQAAEAQKESAIQQRIADTNAQNQTRQQTYQNQRVAANDAALNDQRREHGEDYAAHAVQRDATIIPQSMRPVDPKNPLGPWQGTDVKGRTTNNLGPPAQYLNSPAGKAAQAEKTISDARAAGHPFSAEQEAVVRSGGKLTVRNPVNIRTPAAGTEEYQGSLAAFKQEHGGRGPQTVEEQNQVTQAAKGTLKDNSDAAQTIVDAANGAKQSYAEQYKRNDDGTYTNLATAAIIPGEEFNAKIDGFRTAANVKLQKLGYDVDPHGNLGPTGKQGTPAAAAQPAAGAAPLPQPQQPQTFQYKGSTLTMGQKITIDGKPATFQGIGKTGKIIAGPVSGGQ